MQKSIDEFIIDAQMSQKKGEIMCTVVKENFLDAESINGFVF